MKFSYEQTTYYLKFLNFYMFLWILMCSRTRAEAGLHTLSILAHKHIPDLCIAVPMMQKIISDPGYLSLGYTSKPCIQSSDSHYRSLK